MFLKDLFSSPKAPSVTDPTSVINAQGAANEKAARLTAKLNRPDTYTPFGSVVFEDLGDDKWQSTQTLSPGMQNLFDTQLETGQGISDVALDRVGMLPGDTFNFEGIQDFQGEIDYSALTSLPGEGDFETARLDAEDSSFNRVWDRLGVQFDQEKEDLTTSLLNQGIPMGTEKYNYEMDRFSERKNDARTAAAYDSIAEGRAAFNNLFANALTSRQQGGSEAATNVNLANAKRSQDVSDRLLTRNQPLNELAALLQGSGAITAPQAQGVGGVNVAPPDVGGAYGLAASQEGNRFAAETAQRNAGLSGLFGLGSAALSAG